MSSRKQVTELCSTLGITIDDDSTSKYFDVKLDAPPGLIFACDSLHCLAHFEYKGFGASSEFWQDIKDRIDFGLVSCTDIDCDSCHGYD